MERRIKADMHVHMGLHRVKDRVAKANAFLDTLIKKEIGAVIALEHSFNQPQESFRQLYLTQQERIARGDEPLRKVHLFAGVEYLTWEGMEVILYHHKVDDKGDAHVYQCLKPNLLDKPYYYTIQEVLDIAHREGLEVIIPHPFFKPTGAVGKIGQDGLMKLIEKHGVEGSNTSYDSIGDALRVIGISWGYSNKMARVPHAITSSARYESRGSDAHILERIGKSGLELEVGDTFSREDAYQALMGPKKEYAVTQDGKSAQEYISALLQTAREGVIALGEYMEEHRLSAKARHAQRSMLERFIAACESRDESIGGLPDSKARIPEGYHMAPLSDKEYAAALNNGRENGEKR